MRRKGLRRMDLAGLKRTAHPSAVIIVAPPWPYCGSANIFAAQTAAYAQAGRKVLLLLGPLNGSHCADRSDFWAHALKGMTFPDASVVTYAANYDEASEPYARSRRQWSEAGEDDAIAICARYARDARLPSEARAFIEDHPIDFVHVNHCFEISLGERIAALVEEVHGSRPAILLDTHDIQSLAFHRGHAVNPHSGALDELPALQGAELALCRHADMLLHCAAGDMAYFQARLPEKRHMFMPPSLDPRRERELIADRGLRGSDPIDFLYVGNGNRPNFESVAWLLDEVAPKLERGIQLVLVGSVERLVRELRPDLSERYGSLFVGEVDDIRGYYQRAKAVIAPTISGTGASIKLIEGLCAGKPMIVTNHAVRGLSPGRDFEGALAIRETANDFASAMNDVFTQDAGGGPRSTALYDRLFSFKRYAKRLDMVSRRAVRARREQAFRQAEAVRFNRPATSSFRLELRQASSGLVFARGWHEAETFGRWTSAPIAEALLVLPEAVHGPLAISLTLARPASAPIRLELDGQDAGVSQPSTAEPAWRVAVPAPVRLLRLKLHYEAVSPPSSLNPADPRPLGLAVAAIDVEAQTVQPSPRPRSTGRALMCKTFSPDLSRFEILLKSISAHNVDGLPFIVCAPNADLPAFRRLLPAGATLIAEEEFVEPRCFSWLDGWRQQQVVKLAFHKLGLCDQYLAVDSDSYFIRPFTASDIFGPAGETRVVVAGAERDHGYGALTGDYGLALGLRRRPIYATPDGFFRASPINIPRCFLEDANYKRCPPDLAWQVIPFAFSADGSRGRMTSLPPPMLFSAEILETFEARIAADGLSFVDLIHLAPWEADWYGHFALKYFPDAIRPVTPMFLHFTTDEQIEAARRAGVSNETLAHNYLGVNLAARHQDIVRF
jgi:glycosyltransferase involved in cell wall biosynthesis